MAQQYGDFQLEIYRAGTKGCSRATRSTPRASSAKPPKRSRPGSCPTWPAAAGTSTRSAPTSRRSRSGGSCRACSTAATSATSRSSCSACGCPRPLFTVPIGVIGICSQDFHGDLNVARAAARTGVTVMQSTLSMDPMEDLAPAMGDTPGFFQLYTPKDRDLAVSLIQRAEAAGYKAIVVTLDTWVTGWRPRDLNAANFPQLRGYCLANYFTDEHFSQAARQEPRRRSRCRGRRVGRASSATRSPGTT